MGCNCPTYSAPLPYPQFCVANLPGNVCLTYTPCRICLVASCPGGVASNVITYLARADVPLSVAMTTVSTLAAVVATPVLTRMLVGQLVPVSAVALLLSTLQVSSCV